MSNQAVLHICLSKGWGGLEMYPIRTGGQFREKGWKVLGLCLKGSRVAQGMREQGIETYEVDSKFASIRQLNRIHQWLKQNGVNLIHCHKSGDLVVAALLDTLSSYRVIFTEHMGVTRPKKDMYHRWVYSHVDQVLSISEATKKRNLKALPVPAEKIQRLWLGTEIRPAIDDTELVLKTKKELGIPDDATVIGTVGRFNHAKGQKELLDAFIALVRQNPEQNLHLLMVGGLQADQGSDVELVEEIQATIKQSGLSEQIHLPGFRKDTENMLAVMDIVAILSHNEAFGLTVIEAMAANKLILGANTGAIPEILGESYPFTVNPLDSNLIQLKLVKIISESENISIVGQKLGLRAKTHFDISKHIENLAVVYNKTAVQ
ncbi:glycosyltransferase family 4 protein [Photobacterium alginatilyticum]|nr:glycosyltransferase family 4 protein [Photobacterium alginatilyticum]